MKKLSFFIVLIVFLASCATIQYNVKGSFDMQMKTENDAGELVDLDAGDNEIDCSFAIDNVSGALKIDAGCSGVYEDKNGNIYKCTVAGSSDGKPVRDYFIFETDCKISLTKE